MNKKNFTLLKGYIMKCINNLIFYSCCYILYYKFYICIYRLPSTNYVNTVFPTLYLYAYLCINVFVYQCMYVRACACVCERLVLPTLIHTAIRCYYLLPVDLLAPYNFYKNLDHYLPLSCRHNHI